MKVRAWTAVAAALLGTTACGGAGNSGILRVLFDDPPSSSAEAPAGVSPANVAAVDSTQAAGSAPASVAPRRFAVVHPPFESGDCGDCHSLSASTSFGRGAADGGDAKPIQDRSGARLRFPKDRICFECHDDMTAEALARRAKYLHAPAEGGECLECHDPHESRWAALLRDGDPLEKLCFRCHDADDVLRGKPHATLAPDARTCTLCHDPHGSDREYLLKS